MWNGFRVATRDLDGSERGMIKVSLGGLITQGPLARYFFFPCDSNNGLQYIEWKRSDERRARIPVSQSSVTYLQVGGKEKMRSKNNVRVLLYILFLLVFPVEREGRKEPKNLWPSHKVIWSH